MQLDNPVRDALERGEVALGAHAKTLSPVVVQVFAQLDLDYVFLDYEHIGAAAADSREFERIALLGEAAGIHPLVRIPSGDPELVRKVLDAGIRTLLIPRVETAEEVRRAVEASRFEYDGGPGERGVATSLSSRWGAPPGDYTRREDESVLVGIMLENATALDNIDEILSVPGLGFAEIGPADLSVSLGHPRETDHPNVRAAIDDFREACLSAGVPVGRSATDLDDAERAIDAGFQLVNVGSDVAAIREVLGARLDAL